MLTAGVKVSSLILTLPDGGKDVGGRRGAENKDNNNKE